MYLPRIALHMHSKLPKQQKTLNMMGHMEPREEHYTHNIDSRQDQPIDKVINVIITKRILIDDDHRSLYMRNDSGSKFFYHMKNPLKHSL